MKGESIPVKRADQMLQLLIHVGEKSSEFRNLFEDPFFGSLKLGILLLTHGKKAASQLKKGFDGFIRNLATSESPHATSAERPSDD